MDLPFFTPFYNRRVQVMKHLMIYNIRNKITGKVGLIQDGMDPYQPFFLIVAAQTN